jgi:hypothetical protein
MPIGGPLDQKQPSRPWFSRGFALICIVVALAFWLLPQAIAGPTTPPVSERTPSTTSGEQALAEQKLAEEVRKLKFDNDRADSKFGLALAIGPFVTVIIAVLAFMATVFKQISDREKDRIQRADQQEKDRQQRADQQEKDRQQRADQQEKDRQERFDQQFTTAIANLGSTEDGLRAAGAASLLRLQDSAAPSLQREILLRQNGHGPSSKRSLKTRSVSYARAICQIDPACLISATLIYQGLI